MVAVRKGIFVEQGATFTLSFQWNRRINATTIVPRPLDGWSFRMQIRKKPGSPVLVEATNGNGMIILGVDAVNGGPVDLSNGWITINIPDEDTMAVALKEGQVAYYDLEAEHNGVVLRLLQGEVTGDLNITVEEDELD